MVEDSIPDRSRRTFLKAAGAAAGAATITTTVSADTGTTRKRINVGMSSAVSMSTAEAEVQSETPADSEIYKREETLGFISIDVPEQAAERVKQAFERNDQFRYAEFDVQMHAFEVPNDSLYDQQYSPQQVRAPQAYDKTKGNSDVTIAIIDQGVKYDHPDLAGNFGSVKGKDFVDGDDDPMPESASEEYHGTHVAGSAAAVTDNAEGIAGISNSTLLSARALGTGGGGSLADIAEAIRWSADQGADILNMSLGGGGYRDTMKNAVSYAVSNGALPICAAGNNGSSSVSYPAGYSECVAVSAVDENENLASFSQYGDKCDVASPGVDVLSTWTENVSQFGGKYNKISGTSMACPNASGVAALGLAANPDLGPNELRARLKNTAADIGLSEAKQGAGRVDAKNIVGPIDDTNQKPTVSINASSVTVDAGTAVEFDGTGSSDPDGSIESYDWDFDNGATATGPSATFTFQNPGTYDVQLTVTDDDGASSTDAVAVTVEEAPSENSPPTVSIDAGSTTIPVGADVQFDGSGSADSDGSIASYAWDFGDGTSGSTATVTHAYDSAGDYTVSLTVTDDDGASSTKTLDVTVEPDQGGSCGDTSASSSAESYLRGWYDDESYSFTPDLDDPCQATFSLSGSRRADFDLYVTFDGRTPSTYDYDARSITYGSEEQIVVDDVDGDQEFGILVDSYSGRGSFTITVDELGK
jgi:serine protease